MTYLLLFWEFLRVGLFAFGGAYGAVPLIQEALLNNGWLDEAMFANILAISESTPGPIMVNAATYIGSTQAGIGGAALATLGVVLPSFVIMLLVAAYLRKWLKNRYVQSVLRGIKPCLMGVILATGVYMAGNAIIGDGSADVSYLVILLILAAIFLIYWRFTKKEFSPILLIAISAVLGIMIY